jgi:predicted nuclease of predicted toxin-antitoxin system
MKILADIHISPRTVDYLQTIGHDVLRVDSILPANAKDYEIVEFASKSERVILTQDLDFSAIIALSKSMKPSLISLRLSSSRIEFVNEILERILPQLEKEIVYGVIVSVEDERVRIRRLPL